MLVGWPLYDVKLTPGWCQNDPCIMLTCIWMTSKWPIDDPKIIIRRCQDKPSRYAFFYDVKKFPLWLRNGAQMTLTWYSDALHMIFTLLQNDTRMTRHDTHMLLFIFVVYSLLSASCWLLFTVWCWLAATCFLLLASRCLLFAPACCSIVAVCCLIFYICPVPFATCYWLLAIC